MTFVSPAQRKGHVLRMIKRRLHSVPLLRAQAGPYEDRVTVRPEHVRALVDFVYSDADLGLKTLVDLSAVDLWMHDNEDDESLAVRYVVFYRLASPEFAYRLTIETPLPENDPLVPSLTGRFSAARWLERELYEFYGIYPDGHPDLRPLLLYPGFTGHPLRKDYRKDKDQPLVPRASFPPPQIVGHLTDEAAAIKEQN